MWKRSLVLGVAAALAGVTTTSAGRRYTSVEQMLRLIPTEKWHALAYGVPSKIVSDEIANRKPKNIWSLMTTGIPVRDGSSLVVGADDLAFSNYLGSLQSSAKKSDYSLLVHTPPEEKSFNPFREKYAIVMNGAQCIQSSAKVPVAIKLIHRKTSTGLRSAEEGEVAIHWEVRMFEHCLCKSSKRQMDIRCGDHARNQRRASVTTTRSRPSSLSSLKMASRPISRVESPPPRYPPPQHHGSYPVASVLQSRLASRNPSSTLVPPMPVVSSPQRVESVQHEPIVSAHYFSKLPTSLTTSSRPHSMASVAYGGEHSAVNSAMAMSLVDQPAKIDSNPTIVLEQANLHSQMNQPVSAAPPQSIAVVEQNVMSQGPTPMSQGPPPQFPPAMMSAVPSSGQEVNVDVNLQTGGYGDFRAAGIADPFAPLPPPAAVDVSTRPYVLPAMRNMVDHKQIPGAEMAGCGSPDSDGSPGSSDGSSDGSFYGSSYGSSGSSDGSSDESGSAY